jgi:hypothetical protein
MPTLDIFNTDAFNVSSLTAAINEVPEGQAVSTVVDSLFMDGEEGITTLSVWVEKQGDTLALVPAAERGAPGDPYSVDKRQAINSNAVHLPTRSGVNADEVQNIRAFGSEMEQDMVERLVQQKLDKMRRNLAATITYHRMGAIKGLVLDADGTAVLVNIFSELGVSQIVQSMELDVSTTKVRQLSLAAKRQSEKVTGSSAMITGFLALCGEGFFDALISHDDVKAAYERFAEGEMLRNDPRAGFPFAGIVWRELYGKVGTVEFVGTDDAYLIPLGVPDMFITRWAPADYMETVNTLGLPYYAKQELRRMGTGVDLEAQSNPINLCTRPRAVIKLTKT